MERTKSPRVKSLSINGVVVPVRSGTFSHEFGAPARPRGNPDCDILDEVAHDISTLNASPTKGTV